MLGRTANNVYWMARYVERAENLARLPRQYLPHVADAGGQWQQRAAVGGATATGR